MLRLRLSDPYRGCPEDELIEDRLARIRRGLDALHRELEFWQLVNEAELDAWRARDAIRLRAWGDRTASVYGLGACDRRRVIGKLRGWTGRDSRR